MALEPRGINADTLNEFGFYAYRQLLQFLCKCIAIDKVDWWRTVPCGFFVASFTAAGVKEPVVMNKPLSA